MRPIVVGLTLMLAGLGTARRLSAWTNDVALWTAAVRVEDAARPAVNLAAAYLEHGNFTRAAFWDARAMTRCPDRTARRLVQHHLLWMTAFGSSVCQRPPFAEWC